MNKNITIEPADPKMHVPAKKETISILHRLIETDRDGQEGFRRAAEGIDRSDLSSLFYEFSQQRATFVGELQDLIRTLGADPARAGGFSEIARRGRVDRRTEHSSRNEARILDECERAENAARSEYRAALEIPAPAYIQHVVQGQYSSIVSAHDRIKALRDAANASPRRVPARRYERVRRFL